MMFTLSKDKKVENPLGITSPKKILRAIDAGKSDRIFVRETAYGVELTAYDPEFEKAMEAYKEVSGLYKDALKELAK